MHASNWAVRLHKRLVHLRGADAKGGRRRYGVLQFKGVYMNKGLYRSRLWTADGEVYLGHFDAPEKAGQAYDRASIAYRGVNEAAIFGLNFDMATYDKEADLLQSMEFADVLQQLRGMGAKSTPDVTYR